MLLDTPLYPDGPPQGVTWSQMSTVPRNSGLGLTSVLPTADCACLLLPLCSAEKENCPVASGQPRTGAVQLPPTPTPAAGLHSAGP